MTTHTSRRLVRLLWVAVALAGAGCHDKSQDTSTPAAKPTTEYTAWWKSEGKGGAIAQAAGAGAAQLASWLALPPVEAATAKQGAALFDTKGCAACHSFGQGQKVGPDLLGVTHRSEADWVARFMADPGPMFESDPRAKEMLATYLVKMPNLHLTPDEIVALQTYFRQQDAQGASQKEANQ